MDRRAHALTPRAVHASRDACHGMRESRLSWHRSPHARAATHRWREEGPLARRPLHVVLGLSALVARVPGGSSDNRPTRPGGDTDTTKDSGDSGDAGAAEAWCAMKVEAISGDLEVSDHEPELEVRFDLPTIELHLGHRGPRGPCPALPGRTRHPLGVEVRRLGECTRLVGEQRPGARPEGSSRSGPSGTVTVPSPSGSTSTAR